MNMMELTISGTIINFFEIIMCYKICNEKINFKNVKIYLAWILQTLLLVLNYVYVDNSFKVMITFFIMIMVCKFLFKSKDIINCVIISFTVEVFLIIAEFIYVFVISIISSLNNNVLMKSVEGKFITNIIIAIIFLILCYLKFPKKLYNFLMKHIDNISKTLLMIIFGFIILLISVIFYISYYNENNFITLIVNLAIMIIYIAITTNLIIKENKYKKVRNNYLRSVNELGEYENIINEYRIINHENKNQLNSIKGMTNSKKVHEYIDALLNNKNARNTVILNQALLIPTGGLRGLIYSKMLLMSKYNINYTLHVDKKINSKLLSNISTQTMIDVCQIIGVYLDNAIEAVKNLDKKNILIHIYYNENIFFEIKNNINKKIDESKIDKLGYTTKGKNHGYGLVLANKIIDKNKQLLNKRYITDESFKQQLIVEIK